MSDLVTNFNATRSRIEAAALRSGRDPKEVKLLAVSKSVDAETVCAAMQQTGQTLFGENRVGELQRKIAACPDADFHFIGNLQTNKVRKVVGTTPLIHSVDSQRLLRAIDARAKFLTEDMQKEIVQPVLIQVNVSGEEAKSGIQPDDLDELLHIAGDELNNVAVNGLMTMAPLAPAEDVRWIFRALRELRDRTCANNPNFELVELSMGMTGDFEVAIEEGATLVRVGTALFV